MDIVQVKDGGVLRRPTLGQLLDGASRKEGHVVQSLPSIYAAHCT